MPSSVVRAFTYEPEARRLDVVFTSGRVYSYHDVPSAMFEAMKAPFSKGDSLRPSASQPAPEPTVALFV